MQAPDNPHKSAGAVFKAVVEKDGIKGLWRGATPAVLRQVLMTSSQCVAYEEIKRSLVEDGGFPNVFGTHLLASMVTGVISTTAMNPAGEWERGKRGRERRRHEAGERDD
jgi:hypothetical protein